MLATLDTLAPGRLQIGIGTGWQREEFEAQGLDFDQAWTLLDDQVRAMQVLWREAPASFRSKTVNFERVYSTPFPRDRSIPLWYGVKPTERQARRVAELGAGWVPISTHAEYVRDGVQRIREAFVAAGRDPATLQVRAHAPVHYDADYRGDFERSVADIPELLDAGATVIEFEHHPYITRQGGAAGVLCAPRGVEDPVLKTVRGRAGHLSRIADGPPPIADGWRAGAQRRL
jgi:alkanesulfonate monooxygenase SsuD/methylene tetrahydromethanopterin reductase-like flavin-dependent oxidoreductase (luciferase family)